MAYGESRVYVIGGSTPEVEAGPTGKPVPPPASSPTPATEVPAGDDPLVPVRTTDAIATADAARKTREAAVIDRDPRTWWSLLAPTVLGPFAAAVHTGGRARVLWAFAGVVATAAIVSLLVFGPALRVWAETAPYGPLAWIALLAIGTAHTAAAWALGSRAAAAADRRTQSPSWREEPGHIGVFGFLFPGLGLRVAGCSRLAAAALGITFVGIGAAVLIGNTPWLWLRLRSEVPAGISSSGFELVLLGAVAALTVAAIMWIVQGLDGARRVARTRSTLLTDAVSASLLAAIVVFALAFRPISVASNLHTMASALDAQGFRVIPLALCETAVRLDRASPVYLADAADLLDSLGRHEEAHQHRRTLERRMTDYIDVLGAREGFLQVSYTSSGGALHPARSSDGGTLWQRTAALYE